MAVALAVLPGGAGSADATVRVWDLATPGRGPADRPRPAGGGHRGAAGGRPVAVTGSDDATVRVWDLATGTPAGDPLTGHTSRGGAVLPGGRRSPPATTPRI